MKWIIAFGMFCAEQKILATIFFLTIIYLGDQFVKAVKYAGENKNIQNGGK